MQRAIKRIDSRGDRREDVRLGRSDEANGRRRRVLLVVGVEDQQSFECLAHHGVHHVRLGHGAEVEPQEVVDKAQAVVRVEECVPEALFVRVGGDHGQLGKKADGREFDLLRVARAECVLVVGREP